MIKTSLFVGIAAKSISLVFLVGAVLLTSCIKGVRLHLLQNVDMQVHFNLYVALIFMSASSAAMDLVHYINITDPYTIDTQVPKYYNSRSFYFCAHVLFSSTMD